MVGAVISVQKVLQCYSIHILANIELWFVNNQLKHCYGIDGYVALERNLTS